MLLIHLVKDSHCRGPNREALVFKENGAGPDGKRFIKDGYILAGIYSLNQVEGTPLLPFECEVKRLPEYKPVPNK